MSDAEKVAFPVVPYFVVLLSPGENPAAAPSYFEAHVEHIDAMAADNIVLLGGEGSAGEPRGVSCPSCHVAPRRHHDWRDRPRVRLIQDVVVTVGFARTSGAVSS
jgi:hypothetical protein